MPVLGTFAKSQNFKKTKTLAMFLQTSHSHKGASSFFSSRKQLNKAKSLRLVVSFLSSFILFSRAKLNQLK